MFLNALLGERILPVAVLPLTSVVTILRYGDAPRATVHFQSGQQLEIRPVQLRDYVTEEGNPHNLKRVSHVDVFHPSPHLSGGVTLIDTPGVAGVYAHNTQVTYDFLPRIDAAIFVTSPEPPLTSAEIEFLPDLTEQVSRVFLVMNKADLADARQLSEVLEFTWRSLPAGLRGDAGEIFTVSARQALEAKLKGDRSLLERSGFPVIEERLSRFLREDKSRVFWASVSWRLARLIAELRRFSAEGILEVFDPWRQEFQTSAMEEFRPATGRSQDNINQLIHHVREAAGHLFGVETACLKAPDELAWLEATGYYTDSLLDWGLGNAPLLLPGPLFRRRPRSRCPRHAAPAALGPPQHDPSPPTGPCGGAAALRARCRSLSPLRPGAGRIPRPSLENRTGKPGPNHRDVPAGGEGRICQRQAREVPVAADGRDNQVLRVTSARRPSGRFNRQPAP